MPFRSYQPNFGRDEVFFFLFFVLNLVRSSPKPQNINILKFLCEVVELQTQFCLPKCFRAPPQNGVPKNQVFERFKLGR